MSNVATILKAIEIVKREVGDLIIIVPATRSRSSYNKTTLGTSVETKEFKPKGFIDKFNEDDRKIWNVVDRDVKLTMFTSDYEPEQGDTLTIAGTIYTIVERVVIWAGSTKVLYHLLCRS